METKDYNQMAPEKPSFKSIAYTYGLYLGLLTIIGLVVQYVLGLREKLDFKYCQHNYNHSDLLLWY